MKYTMFVTAILFALLFLTYDPAEKTLTGTVQSITEHELIIPCMQDAQPKFKPSDDIGYSCTIEITDDTNFESHEPIRIGQQVTVELTHKVKLTPEHREALIAKTITVVQ